MAADWVRRVRESLLTWRGADAGWGYRPESPPCVEPTVMAALALLADGEGQSCPDCCRAAMDSARWLATIQQSSGALGLSATMPAPRWGTALGLLAWSATGECPEAVPRALEWMLTHGGTTWAPTPDTAFGHDTTIPGWAWVEGTHSWVEPTAWAVLALRRVGQGEHERTRDGQRLLRDRSLRSGGWNYGNSQVFGTDLRPQPGPTGLALLALAGGDDPDAPRIALAGDYLERVLPTTHAPQSLCWGILGLEAWGRRPPQADAWLAAAVDRATGRSDRSVQLSYLLLAAGARALDLLGIPAVVSEERT